MNMFSRKIKKEDEQVGIYYQTNNYSKFSTLESSNRDANPQHVEKLKKSIQEIGLITPIQVDKDFVIVDGQHRFHALKSLGYPITYQSLEVLRCKYSKNTKKIPMNNDYLLSST